ncbi:UDP-N-acetylenolpyruvoylglucosamine reductase [bacterium]|nr:MAG: UDP-N-acetylenolpyruvoylglucosamine reductase [bacterium]
MTRPEYIEQAPLAARTTLGIGGPAHRIARVADGEALQAALEENRDRPVAVLGSGSNLIVSDRGYDGLLLQSTDLTRDYDPASGELQVGAGVDFDDLVRFSIDENLAGLECLSGIPGLCGAAPVQNIGAYGQEIATVIVGLQATDLHSGQRREFSAAECGFAYRASRFKHAEAGRWMITRLHLRLRPGAAPTLAYRELTAAFADNPSPSLDAVRNEVLRLRRGKSMVYDPSDPNHRSAGSFFTNPVVSADEAEQVSVRAGTPPPSWPTDDGAVKLAAAWLIDNAGLAKGHRSGPVGLSSNHVLALVNHGQARASDLLAFATEVRDRVRDRFGITLCPEPVPLGFTDDEVADLWGPQSEL